MSGTSVTVFDMAICAGHHFVDLFLCTFFIDAACSWKEIIQHIYMHVLSGELEIKEKVAYNVNYFLHVQVVCNILIIFFSFTCRCKCFVCQTSDQHGCSLLLECPLRKKKCLSEAGGTKIQFN